MAFILVVLGLHFLGAVQLPVDRLNRRALRSTGRSGFCGAFGLVASPCSTPVLAVIATMAAAGRSPATGAFLLFVYGLGKGVPLLLIGLASGSMRAMRPLSRATPILTKFGVVARCAAEQLLLEEFGIEHSTLQVEVDGAESVCRLLDCGR